MKNFAVDKGTTSVPSLHIESSRNQTESSQKHHTVLLKHEAEDSSINASSTSAIKAHSSAKENKQCNITLETQLEDMAGKQLLNHSHLADEYRSLASSPHMRSSLRSPEKIRAGLTRGGFRVTFSEDNSLESSLEKDRIGKPQCYYPNQDFLSSQRLHSSDTNKTSPYKFLRDTSLDSYDHLYPSYTPQNKDFVQRPPKDKKSPHLRDYNISFGNERKPALPSTSNGVLTQNTEMDNRAQGFVKLSSELNISTPLSDDPALSAARFSTLSTSFNDLPSRHQPLSAEALCDHSLPAPVGKTVPAAMPWKDSDSTVNRCLSPSRAGCKQGDRGPSSLSPQQRCTASKKEPVPSNASNDTSFTERQSPKRAEKTPPIAVVLKQLLELVDCYWDGAGSLLRNKNFLAPAQDLLLYLISSTPPQKAVHLPGGDSPSVLAENAPRSQRSPLTYMEQCSRVDVVWQQAKRQDDCHAPSPQIQELDYTATSNYCFSGKHSLTYGELLQKNEQLKVQVENLTVELKQLKKLQETVNLLQDSQRSLVSTNNFLLQQLHKEHVPNSGKPPLPSEKLTLQEQSLGERNPPGLSAHDYGQYCHAGHLSNCPL